MAELAGFDTKLRARPQATLRMVLDDLFPGAGNIQNASYWTGLRPMTPDGTPVVGATKLANLFLNTGHGTLGWTHSCGSGKSIARIVSGLAPEVDFAFTGVAPSPRSGVALQPAAQTR